MSLSIFLLTSEDIADTFSRLFSRQVERLLSQYHAVDTGGEVPSLSDTRLLQEVDMYDSGPYEITDPRTITVLETYIPSREFEDPLYG